MKKFLLAVALVAVVLVGFANRVDNTVQIPFAFSAAAGWLNVSDGREFPLKGTNTVNKFGHNVDADAAEESVWDGNDLGGPLRCFTVPGSAANIYLTSSDENDASDNDGISVTVEYLDASWDLKTLSVALGVAVAGGTTSVQIGSSTIMRINRMYPTTTALSGNVYASIDSDAGTDGVPDTPLTDIVAVIDLTEQQTMQACYSVPNGFNALMTMFAVDNVATANNRTATFRLRAAVNSGSSRTKQVAHIDDGIHFQHVADLPIMFTEKTDIELTILPSGADAIAAGAFDLLLVPNDS